MKLEISEKMQRCKRSLVLRNQSRTTRSVFHLPQQSHSPSFLELKYQFFFRAVLRKLPISSVKKTKLTHSFYRATLSKQLYPHCKTNQQLVVWGKQSFQVQIQKLFSTYKYLEERCFRPVTSVRQSKKSQSSCGIRLSVSSSANSSLSDSESYLCFMKENTGDCLHIY